MGALESKPDSVVDINEGNEHSGIESSSDSDMEIIDINEQIPVEDQSTELDNQLDTTQDSISSDDMDEDWESDGEHWESEEDSNSECNKNEDVSRKKTDYELVEDYLQEMIACGAMSETKVPEFHGDIIGVVLLSIFSIIYGWTVGIFVSVFVGQQILFRAFGVFPDELGHKKERAVQ